LNTDKPTTDVLNVINETLLWLDDIVIGQQFCPFAKPVREHNTLHIAVQQQTDMSSLLRQVITECEQLLEKDNIETSLLIYTEQLHDYFDYLDFLDMANEAIATAGLEGTLQLASFHPNYQFADAPSDCPSNFTNRSPYPMIHIIQEQSITEALESFANAENIPQRNIEHAKKLGIDFFLPYLQNHSSAKE
jgi:hypothetical protein